VDSGKGSFAAPEGAGRLSLLAAAEIYLERSGVADGRSHAEWLLGHVLSVARAELYLRGDEPISDAAAAEFAALVVRRAAGEPTQYILGETEFYSLKFTCDRRALIPRPETELLVDRALALAKEAAGKPYSLLDLGTGSGCIAVSLAVHLPELQIVAGDLKASAIELARINAKRHGVAERIEFRVSDLFSEIPESFDLIAANLPYVPSVDRSVLQREVRDWEPAWALFAGTDGLEFLEPAIRRAPDHIWPGGHLVLEIGAGQLSAVRGLMEATSRFTDITHVTDYQGHPRVVVARRY
jgi:release factor glutamine methyltransferase